MGTALSMMDKDDPNFYIYSAGPFNLNALAVEFANVSERNLKLRGISVKFKKIPSSWIKDNISDIDYFAYFSKPGEGSSDIVDYADSNGVEVGVYRY